MGDDRAVFQLLEQINEFVWAHVAFLLILGLGGYFTIRSGFFQIRKFPAVIRCFGSFFAEKTGGPGVHPMKAFFAAIGGCIGIGNVVGICTAVQIGGPGALFWAWVGGLMGMLIQYAEIYLGMKYRVRNESGSYDGGPMYFLPAAYKVRWVAPLVCILLCVYGVEIFMFNVMADSIATNWAFDPYWVVAILLVATLAVGAGGINRVGEVCSAIIPLFILLYLGMAFWVLGHRWAELPGVFASIFEGAFTTQAALGGFAGSSVMLTISMGLSRGAYSGDIGIGYNAIIHAESRVTHIGRQASLGIIGIFIDTFVICTLSILLVLTTGHWNSGIDPALMVQEALGLTFPYMHFFMPFFLFLLGYSTILAYFVVGVKCAKFLSRRWGPLLYYTYAAIALPLFAFIPSTQAFVIMSLSGAALLLLNLTGMFLLRKQVTFNLS
ncbi:MAG: sodium:alanine symporter family protein [Verrucomicrobiota bacterium]|nr:sodium:alanine symporter family protein [Verrucomicrobiota bacterium]